MKNKKLSENTAINIISGIYHEYTDMNHTESPDYFKRGLCLEITHAISSKSGETNTFVQNNLGKGYTDLSINWLHKNGYIDEPTPWGNRCSLYIQRNSKKMDLLYLRPINSQELILIGYISQSFEEQSIQNSILKSLHKKLVKLNKNYKIQKYNDLCIIIPEQIGYGVWTDEVSEVLLNEIIVSLRNIYSQRKFAIYFDRLFLVFEDYLYRIDTTSWKYSRHKVR
ncbi:MAG: hypothetical protein K6G47_01345 [Clostridia bacterium]|nr:hypothetical protein [Clostridia bacterium]